MECPGIREGSGLLGPQQKMHQAEESKRNLNVKQGQIGTGRGCSGQRSEALTHGKL